VAITVVVPTLPQTAELINGPATFDVTLAAGVKESLVAGAFCRTQWIFTWRRSGDRGLIGGRNVTGRQSTRERPSRVIAASQKGAPG
jgi:hypothetical protein